MGKTADPWKVIADALHGEYCDDAYDGDPAVHRADENGHLMDADVILDALQEAGYTVVPSAPVAVTLAVPGGVTRVSGELLCAHPEPGREPTDG